MFGNWIKSLPLKLDNIINAVSGISAQKFFRMCFLGFSTILLVYSVDARSVFIFFGSLLCDYWATRRYGEKFFQKKQRNLGFIGISICAVPFVISCICLLGFGSMKITQPYLSIAFLDMFDFALRPQWLYTIICLGIAEAWCDTNEAVPTKSQKKIKPLKKTI